jgi:protein involved in polysaccharide export with SLBB domain
MKTPKPCHVALVALALGCLATQLPAQAPDDTVRVGDRILLRVEGEQQLSDTFTVSPGPALVLPTVGELALKDVRRAEAERYLARELARFLREPVVHARVLVRLAVLGEVERPGFYAVPADAILTQAIMTAGGPTRDAKFSGLRIERDHAPVWSGDALQQSITRGLTVDQMRLRSGDLIVVPRRHNAAATAQVLGILLTIPAAIYGLTRLF